MLRRSYAKLLILLALAFAAAACGPAGGGPTEEEWSDLQTQVEQQGWNNFQTAVADPDRNYDIYWLGREVEVGGEVMRGPEALAADDPGGEVDGGGLVMSYLGDPGSGLDLRFTLYSRAAWDRVQDLRSRGAQPRRFEVKDVTVAGWPAKLQTVFIEPGFSGAGEVNWRILSIDYGSTVVEASTQARRPATPTAPQPNPLIDEATFLSVMQRLRPYPE
jgi:hypothetical protein